jgi:hypothetical protein
MARVTFEEIFNESLEQTIRQGGDIETVLRAANLYQKIDNVARSDAFGEWLEKSTYFICGSCGYAFAVFTKFIQEEEYVLCSKCSKK